MNQSQFAINSISTRGSFEETLAAYSAAGFTNVEFFLGHLKSYLAAGHSLDEVKRLLRDLGLRCIGGFETGLEAFSQPEQRSRNHAVIVENARLLGELGGGCLVVGTDGPSAARDDPMGAIAQALAEVAERLTDTDVTLCLEFNWSPLVKSFRTAAEIVRRSGARNVGVLFDPAHYHCTPSKFEQLTLDNVRTIKHVHVNNMLDKPGELSNCNADRVLPGEGCLDLHSLFGRIEQGGYSGYFSIEMFSEELWGQPVGEASRRMYRSLLTLLDGSAGVSG